MKKIKIFILLLILFVIIYIVISNFTAKKHLHKYKDYLVKIKFDKLLFANSINQIRNDSSSAAAAAASSSSSSAESNQTNYKRPRIFCFILTRSSGFETRTKTVYETWAHKCDNHKFISVLNKEYIRNNKKVNLLEESVEVTINNTFTVLQPAGLVNDTYDILSKKVLFTLKDIYKRYNGYDWYLKTDDDSFIFVDNLREFVRDKKPSEPVTFGYDFKVIVDKGYHSGGGGYLLSREALNRIGAKLNEDFNYCKIGFAEDVDVAKCMRSLDIYPKKSSDSFDRERFHCLSLNDFYQGNFPEWLFSYAKNPIKKGVECCSDTTISFHYMPPHEQIRLNSILQEQKKTKKDMSFKYIIKKYFNIEDDSKLNYETSN